MIDPPPQRGGLLVILRPVAAFVLGGIVGILLPSLTGIICAAIIGIFMDLRTRVPGVVTVIAVAGFVVFARLM